MKPVPSRTDGTWRRSQAFTIGHSGRHGRGPNVFHAIADSNGIRAATPRGPQLGLDAWLRRHVPSVRDERASSASCSRRRLNAIARGRREPCIGAPPIGTK